MKLVEVTYIGGDEEYGSTDPAFDHRMIILASGEKGWVSEMKALQLKDDRSGDFDFGDVKVFDSHPDVSAPAVAPSAAAGDVPEATGTVAEHVVSNPDAFVYPTTHAELDALALERGVSFDGADPPVTKVADKIALLQANEAPTEA